MQISVTKTNSPKTKPDSNNLGFGQHFSDHMFIMDYNPEKGWHDARVVPYAPLNLDPATMVLHYGQAIFEGLKAYNGKNGEVLLFRPEKNLERINLSNERLGIPPINEKDCLEALIELVKIEKDWIPSADGASLYLRPFIIATDPYLGVRPSDTYKFIIICSPSGMYYKEGLSPVKIFVEDNYVRAVKGGMGFSKTPGNYAASLKAQILAHDKGYSQVLWLDGVERKYVEEVGAMNVFFMIGDEIITPELNGSILGGITRMSVIEMLRKWSMKVSERQLSIDEIYEASEKGSLKEAFGTGTAAVISPIGELNWGGKIISVAGGNIGEVTSKLYNEITGIQKGEIEDTLNWTVKL